MAEVYVLDASALIAYLDGEPGGERVRALIAQAETGEVELQLHALQVGEIYYIFYRRAGFSRAEEVLKDLRGFAIRLQDRISLGLLKEAGRIKASYRLSYADAFAVGLARLRGAQLVSCDHRELEPLEAAGEVMMLWVR